MTALIVAAVSLLDHRRRLMRVGAIIHPGYVVRIQECVDARTGGAVRGREVILLLRLEVVGLVTVHRGCWQRRVRGVRGAR